MQSMSMFFKRNIHSVMMDAYIYSSRRSEQYGIRNYIDHAVKEWCKTTPGFDDSGAQVAIVKGTGHAGGTDPAEPFHITIQVTNANGDLISKYYPHLARWTTSHHVYIARNAAELANVSWNFMQAQLEPPVPPVRRYSTWAFGNAV